MTAVADAPPALVRSRHFSRPLAFAAIAAIFLTFTSASAAPSPLYVVYQHLWGFSATTLTVVFAIYVVGLVGALLTLGALSDHLGRRPVLAAAIGLEVVALVLFLTAGDVAVLSVARFLQGIATGAAMTTLGAALVDLNPPHAPGRAGLVNGIIPSAGLAFGALGAGALVQYAPAPTHFVWALLLGAMVIAGLVVLRLPETSARRPGAAASLAPKLGIPARLRADVFALVPIIVASWAIGGLYLSLGPSVAAGVFGLGSHLIGGLVVTLLCGTGALTSYALRGLPTPRVLAIAASLLTVGAVISVAGVEADQVVIAAVGTVISGVGFGASALASFGTLALLADPHERGELLAVALVIAYIAFSVPAVIAGFAATSAGLQVTAVAYGVVVAVLGALALVAQRLRSRRAATA
ncbi:MFS transporter [Paractinoplanes deccanensis]|uniref:MFS transporter n=1 Tax=Paractinoplanes deccanensis TaxID=113561 RepID=A0ABQ3YJ99_9ACTN|nr:MFS transporter [Actinoplanes deccanensis]GID80073.1 MFS transporter [Actinoplanes deccanensis]